MAKRKVSVTKNVNDDNDPTVDRDEDIEDRDEDEEEDEREETAAERKKREERQKIEERIARDPRAEKDDPGAETGGEYEIEQNPPGQYNARTDRNTAKAKSVDETHGTSLTPVHDVVNPANAGPDDKVGVAGTTMTEAEAKELVEAGEGDTLAEHGPPE